MAIVLAHTMVEAPNQGASSRAAAISAPSEEAPTTNATRVTGGPPFRSPAGPESFVG